MTKKMELGVTRVDITPKPSMCKHISLGGYSRMHKCKGIQEKIFARIMHLRKPQQHVGEGNLIICVDLVGVPYLIAFQLRQIIAERWGFSPGKIFIYATHNHYTPDIMGLMAAPIFPMIFSPAAINYVYINFFLAKILQAIPKTFDTEPGTIGLVQKIYPDNDLLNRRRKHNDLPRTLKPK